MTKTNPGNFFEDFRLGQEIAHATPRTVTEGDMALYTALSGSRFALHSVRHLRPGRSGYARSHRSTTCWPSMSSSARRCPTSR